MTHMELSFPALNGAVVTERHARFCRENGHATHTVDGEVSPWCPRCGDNLPPVLPLFYGKPIDTPTGHKWAGHTAPTTVCTGEARTIGGREEEDGTRVDVLTVRADEVRVGDTIPMRGIVGTVVDTVRYSGNLPRVEITARTTVGGETVHDVFATDRALLIERTR